MNRCYFFIFVVLLLSQSWAKYVAIVETLSEDSTTTLRERQYLTDVLRSQAVEILPSNQNYTIMTRENIRIMLPPDKSIEDCEGDCLIETGRNISADYIAQARINRFGISLAISVELYETAESKLIASFNGQGKDVYDLLDVIKNNAPSFFGKIRNTHNTLEKENLKNDYSKYNIPINAHKTIYGWACNEGFFQNGELSCDVMPEFAHDAGNYNWACNNGYKKTKNHCEPIPQCNSNEIYILSTNSCNPIPENAFKLNENSWICNEGFHMNESKTKCLYNQTNESLETIDFFAWNVGGSFIIPFTASFKDSDPWGGQLYIGFFFFYNFEKFRIGSGLHYELNYICLSSPLKEKKSNFINKIINRHYLLHRLDLSLLTMYGNKVKFFAKPKISFNLYGNNEWTKIDYNNEIYSDVVIEWEIKKVSFEIDMGISVGSWNFYIGYTRPMVEDSFSKNYHSLLLGVSWAKY